MTANSNIILLHISGRDEPGILSGVTRILCEQEVEIRDLQQTTSLGQLSLSVLIRVPADKGLFLIRDMGALFRQRGLSVDFVILGDEDEGQPPLESASNLMLTYLAPSVDGVAFHSLVQKIAALHLNVERINWIAHGSIQCLELTLNQTLANHLDFQELRRELFGVAFAHGFDLAIQPEHLYRRSKRLVVMDMDSTLVQQEVIDEIAAFAGVKAEVAAITEQAMRGEIDFKAALRARVALLKGLDASCLEEVLTRIQLTPGAETLVRVLKKLGYKIAVVSGGFSFFTQYFRECLSLDYAFANTLEIVDGQLTGELNGEIVDRQAKARILRMLAHKEQIPLDQTVAVGDGANDLDMLEAAGLGVAFNAKPMVREQAPAFLSLPGLDSILYLLGVSQRDLYAMDESQG